MNKPKAYCTAARTDSDYTDIPAAVVFIIDENTARNIIRLSRFVKAHDLYKVEKFDYRAAYLNRSPEEDFQDAGSEADDEENEVRVDSNVLNVTDTEFWFSAFIKHTHVEILSEEISIAELVEHFGLGVERAPSLASLQDVVTYLDTLPLPEALWWFIENANDDATWRTEVFFHLRARIRESPSVTSAKKGPKRKPVCPKCESDDIVADAAGRWDSASR
jgi:hypothetical protein